MKIIAVTENKRQFMDLLLIADEQESMIEKYLDRGHMYAMYDEELIGTCIVTDEGDGVYELKNIAIYEQHRGKGYGKKLVEYVLNRYKDRAQCMMVGTGDSPLTIPFYQGCGFVESHRIPNFFIDHYDHVMIEGGVQLKDMVYLKRSYRRT